MLIRCGFLLIGGRPVSKGDDSALAEVQGLLAGVVDGVLPLVSRSYTEPPRYQVEETLRRWCDEEELDLILTVGGTFPAPGPSQQEIVPDATAAVLERTMPSLPEAMRARAAESNARALLDRGVAGIRGRTLIVNLPGERALATAFLESILDLIPSIAALLAEKEEPAIAEDAAMAPAEQDDLPHQSGTLNHNEFAAFLKRRQVGGSDV